MVNYYLVDLAAGMIAIVLPHERAKFVAEFEKMWADDNFEHDTDENGKVKVEVVLGEEHMYQRITIKVCGTTYCRVG